MPNPAYRPGLPPTIPDPDAEMPGDWDEEEDGEDESDVASDSNGGGNRRRQTSAVQGRGRGRATRAARSGPRCAKSLPGAYGAGSASRTSSSRSAGPRSSLFVFVT